ncbi:MAG: PDZ domain-containing protein, partial [Nitrospinota bacterium]
GRCRFRRPDYRKASKLDNRKVWKNVIRKNIGFVYASLGNMKKASLFFGDEFVAGLRYEKVPEGIQVTEVNKGLPGEMAGVQLQDILIAADDQPLEGLDLKAISDLFDKKPRNSSIKLTVLREKKRKEIFLQKSMGPGAEGS